jgi:hypothetical protein
MRYIGFYEIAYTDVCTRMTQPQTHELGDAWDQREEEPKIWYERFSIFRLIGPGRSIAKAYRKWRLLTKGEITTKYTSNNWYDVAREWHWEERASAWDDVVREEQEDVAQEVYADGLSFAHERVRKLKLVAKKLEDYILDIKTTRISPYIIEQYRGILDDIAKERGERQKETRVTGVGGGAIMIETQWGRGGSATDAWNQLAQPVVEAVVEEVAENNGSE